jgi:hypothetical protein
MDAWAARVSEAGCEQFWPAYRLQASRRVHLRCAVPDVDFEGPAHDVSVVTKREHQALSISFGNLERTYSMPFAKSKPARPSPERGRWASGRVESA